HGDVRRGGGDGPAGPGAGASRLWRNGRVLPEGSPGRGGGRPSLAGLDAWRDHPGRGPRPHRRRRPEQRKGRPEGRPGSGAGRPVGRSTALAAASATTPTVAAAPTTVTAAATPVTTPSAPVTATASPLTTPLLAAATRHRHLHPLVLRGVVVRRLHDDGLAGEPYAAGLVDVDDLDGHLVALLDEVGDLADAVGGELADVHQAVGARHDFHEGAVGLDPPYHAGVGLAHLRHLGQALDHLDRAPGRRLVRRGDDHPTVVFDVD